MKNFKLKNLVFVAAITLVATATVVLPTKASAAWRQADNGSWSYSDGDATVSGWKSIDGKWYFFDSSSVMKTGWVNDGGKWYYLASSGEMKTGWISDGGKWYYTNPSGDMQTGWLLNNGTWYYLNQSGDMKTGLLELNGKTYYLSDSGAMKTGTITINGVSYTFGQNGEKVTASTANQNTTTGTTNTATSTSSGGSGGSGGSSSGNSGSKDDTDSSYEDLYRTWTVGDVVYKGTKLDDETIALCEGKSITIDSNSITFNDYNTTVPVPSIKKEPMTSSDFYKKYKIKVSGDKVTSYSATIKVELLKRSASVTVYIADGQAYALLGGALFELN